MSYNAVTLAKGDGTVVEYGTTGSSGGSGSSLPEGGTAGQVLAKASNTDYDVSWQTKSGAVGTVINLTTETAEYYGQAVTLVSTNASYTVNFDNTGHATAHVFMIGTYTITCSDTSATQEVTAMGMVYSVDLTKVTGTTVTIQTPYSDMYSTSLTIKKGGSSVGTVALDGTGTGEFVAPETGTYTIEYSTYIPQPFEVTELGTTMTVNYITAVTAKTFAAATDSEISRMVKAADAGYTDLYTDCGWRVGQEHSVSLASMSSSGTYDGVSWSVGESQSAQSATFVLMHQGLYELVTPVKDTTGATRNTCSFICGMKDCLSTKGYMNSTNTNNGSWQATARRNWCNGAFRQALPAVLQEAFKQFKCVTGQYSGGSTTGGSNITTNDYFALAAGKEIFNGGSSTSYSTDNEANVLTQFTWYATTSNRVKNVAGSADDWWERSPRYNGSNAFCYVLSDGSAGSAYASNSFGLSVFGCL